MADKLEGRRKRGHPGFKAVQREIAGQYGGDMERAGRILASRTRAASPSAKKRNPRLLKVRGKRG